MTAIPLRCIAALAFTIPTTAQNWLPSSPFPAWGTAPPSVVRTIDHDPNRTPVENGARLYATIRTLAAGEGLAIGPGVWSIASRFDLNGVGSAAAPFWLFGADPQRRPVLTRPDAQQNAVNVGSNAPARYWVLRDLEITGGSDLVRLYDCAHVWIDRCHLHDGRGVGIAAQTVDTSFLHITRNEIARPGPGTNGEGMYLGGNNGSVKVSWSVVAFNHVLDTRGAVTGQGDGIELKQGSHHNWLVGNRVHDCRNPCILVYGTGGNGLNVVENNVCFDSDDVVLQVQGEAIVRNNVAVGGGVAFGSHDHQGASRDLHVVHNTFVNRGRAASMQAWSGRPGMVFANNVVYSVAAEAVHFGNGSAGVQLAGNVAFGSVTNAARGFTSGGGLADFVDVALSPFRLDVTPVVGGAIDNRGSATHRVPFDLGGTLRELPVDPGARTNAATLQSPVAHVDTGTGGLQRLAFALPTFAGAEYHVLGSVSGAIPGVALPSFELPLNVDAWLTTTLQFPGAGGLHATKGRLDAHGGALATIVLPPLPATLRGHVLRHALVATRGASIVFVSNPVELTLR